MSFVKKYVDARQKADELREKANDIESAAERDAELAQLPGNLREAVPEDIIVGAAIWYPGWRENDPGSRCWNIVDKVLRPNDPFKAYCAHDGCRYGLDGAFVEL